MKAALFGVCGLVLLASSAAAEEKATPVADIERGMSATISGTVERILDEDEFRLADETGSIRVYIGPNEMPVSTGDEVSVEGWMDDDFLFSEFYARELTMADGRTVQFQHRYE